MFLKNNNVFKRHFQEFYTARKNTDNWMNEQVFMCVIIIPGAAVIHFRPWFIRHPLRAHAPILFIQAMNERKTFT